MYKNLKNILKTLTLSNNNDTAEVITHTYKNKGFCIVHFLYFATIVLNKLDIKILPENGNIFTQSLISGDFLLPDGIALQVLYRKYFKQEIPNLNGTDFLSYFLSNLSKNKNVEIYLYGGTNDVAGKAAIYISDTFQLPVISFQNGYGEFDWNIVPLKKIGTTRILLVGRGSPIQEIWTENNRVKIQEMECLVFTVGGLLDFWAGIEKRAPVWMRTAKIEWLYRAISNPKKNLKKTLVSLQLLRYLISK